MHQTASNYKLSAWWEL